MNARQDWLKARQAGIGGSDVSAILGLSKWKTPYDIFVSKVEPIAESADEEMSEPAYWGTVLEDVVAKEYSKRGGHQIQRVNRQLKHASKPWMLANIDRALVQPGSRVRVSDDGGTLLGAAGLLECKTASAYASGEWGRDGDDEAIPIYYAAQGMWYLAVTGQPYCDFAALLGGQKFLTKRLERDEEVIKALTERCEAFWFDHVLKGIAPPAINAADVLKMFPSDNGQAVEATEQTLIAYNEAVQLRAQIKAAEEELAKREEAIKMAIGEAAGLATMGKNLVTWKAAKPSQKVDWESIAKEFAAYVTAPEPVIANHTKQVDGSRRFLFAKQ